MAVQRVEELLRTATAALEAARVPYAVVGGNAVSAWVSTVDDGAVRATKDVDILIRREDLGAVKSALQVVGLDYAEVLGVSMFLQRERPNPRTGVHVVFAREHIRPGYRHPAPDVADAVASPAGHRVIALAPLLAMKLQANRPIDQVHVEDMHALGLITPELAAQLPPDLHERLNTILSRPS